MGTEINIKATVNKDNVDELKKQIGELDHQLKMLSGILDSLSDKTSNIAEQLSLLATRGVIVHAYPECNVSDKE